MVSARLDEYVAKEAPGEVCYSIPGDLLILTSRPQDIRLDRTSAFFKAPQF